MAVLPTVQGGRLNKLVKACLRGTCGCQWNHKQGNHFREPEGKRKRERERERETETETEHAEPVSGFRSQAIFSEWMRMPNMSHRAPTLNSEKETSRKSHSFWQSVIARALRSYMCTTVCTVYTLLPQLMHTYIYTMKRKISLCQICHTCRQRYIQTQTHVSYCIHTHRHVMLCCVQPTHEIISSWNKEQRLSGCLQSDLKLLHPIITVCSSHKESELKI